MQHLVFSSIGKPASSYYDLCTHTCIGIHHTILFMVIQGEYTRWILESAFVLVILVCFTLMLLGNRSSEPIS